MRVSIIIPAYNEEDRLESSLETVMAFFAEQPELEPEIIVVSDGSRDRTNAIAQSYADSAPAIELVAYQPNRGKGYAVRQGMLEATGDVAILSDADLSTPITELPRFLDFWDGKQDRVVIASRAWPSSRVGGWRPPTREWGGIAFNRFVQAAALPGTWDSQCGFKLFPGPAAKPLFGRCLCDGFAYDVEVLVVARHLGFHILELGVPWDNDPATKVSVARDMFPAARDVLQIANRRRRGYYDRASNAV